MGGGRWEIDAAARVAKPIGDLALRISEGGYLYRKVRRFVNEPEVRGNDGLVMRALCAALAAELKEVYRLVAVLQGDKELTLRRMLVWTLEPIHSLRVLSTLCDVSKVRTPPPPKHLLLPSSRPPFLC
jgi:gamma-tubulin complex component 3